MSTKLLKVIAFIIRQLVRLAPWDFFIASIAETGWGIAIEKVDDDANIEGLVVGTEDYIDRHIPVIKEI